MYKLTHYFVLAAASLLFLSLTACDYTAPEGGTLDVRLNSTQTSLEKAEVTITSVSIGSVQKGQSEDAFGKWPNMLSKNETVDLTTLGNDVDMLLSSANVQPGDFNEVHVELADSARIKYLAKDGKSVQDEVAITDTHLGNVIIEFDPILLEDGDERAVLSLQFDIDDSFVKNQKTDAYDFSPALSAQKLMVKGVERSLSQ